MTPLQPSADNPSRGVVDDWTAADNGDYDRSIHANPSAEAWADFFVATFPKQAHLRDLMRGWFANAMMAMHDHLRYKAQAAALPAVPDRCCAACKGSGEVEALTPHASGDPQDAYMAPATCEVCDGNGGADPWMPVASVLPMTPGWYVCVNHGRVEPLRFDGAYWHHTRMTRDLAGPSHWRTFESIATPAHDQPEGEG